MKASVQAIESRDPTTSGHSNRVAVYTVSLAKAVDRVGNGVYSDVHFTAEHLKEIRYASLLHDFGKVGVREHVLVKAKKLYPQQMDLLKLRMEYIQKSMLYGILTGALRGALRRGQGRYLLIKPEIDRQGGRSTWRRSTSYLQTIVTANEPSVLAEEPDRILDEIHSKSFIEAEGKTLHFLEDDEYVKLKIKKGSLDEAERKEIESHVTHTFLFLRTIPWTKEMRNIPTIAYGHHEKLRGRLSPRHPRPGDPDPDPHDDRVGHL